MMTLRAGGPPCCGAAGPPASPSTTNDKAIKKLRSLITKPLGQRPWGHTDFYVEDPDGYILCFSEETA